MTSSQAAAAADIFDRDPLIPIAWRGRLEPLGGVARRGERGGHGRDALPDEHPSPLRTRNAAEGEAETFDWMGPAVSRTKALDTGAALRARIAEHRRIMVLNDEAHHLWDPGSAWNEAIARAACVARARWRHCRATRFFRDAEGQPGPDFQARGVRHSAGGGGGCGHREDARARQGQTLGGPAEQGCLGTVPGATHGRLRALENLARGMGGERKKAAALRDDRRHRGGQPDRATVEQRPTLQGTQRPDGKPAHEAQGQDQVDRREEGRAPGIRRK